MDGDHPEADESQAVAAAPPASDLTNLLIRIMVARAAKISRLHEFTPANRIESLAKDLIGGIVGNVLEWYDFAVFGFFAPVIGEQFFPSDDPMDSLLGAFSVFAAAYVVRPIGGAIFGYIGDQFGRKKALQISVMMMAVPTCLIGILPTHAEIGTAAPILLVVLRMAQGLSVGGELIGSIAFVTETAPASRRGYFGSWTFASCYGGMTLGSLSAVWLDAALGPKAVASWGWRLPFLAGIFIGLAGLWMRRQLKETPVFEKMKAEGTVGANPLTEAVRRVPWRIFHASVLVILVGGGFYILFVWWPTLLTRYIHPHVPQAMQLNTISMILLVALIPVTGRLSDRWGRKPLLVAGSAGLMLLSWPLFSLVEGGQVFFVAVAQLSFTVLMSLYLGPIPATLVAMFPARLRNSGIGLAYNVSLCIFGGSAPLVATWLVKHYRNVSAPGVYLTILSGLTLVAALSLPEPVARRRRWTPQVRPVVDAARPAVGG